jgi:hypothetical protein
MGVGDRLEDEAGIRRELEPALPDRCHFRRSDDAQEDLAGPEGGGEAEQDGGELLPAVGRPWRDF